MEIKLKSDMGEADWVYMKTGQPYLTRPNNGIDYPTNDGISVAWKAKNDGQYGIWIGLHHLNAEEESMKDVPVASDKVWTLFKLKRKLVIECNAIKVYELQYKDLFDRNSNLQRSIKGWSKIASKIVFDDLDKATENFRPAGKASTYSC